MTIKLSRYELLLIIGFYVFMALNYYIALYIDLGVTTHYRAILLNHGVKALLSFPLSLLVLKYMKDMNWGLVLLIHFLILPIQGFESCVGLLLDWLILHHPIWRFTSLSL